MTAPLPFPVAARCGYCDRRLVDVERGYECPRCAPLLRALPDGSGYEATLAAYRTFKAEAWRDREHPASNPEETST